METLNFRACKEAICAVVGNARSTRFSYGQRSRQFGMTVDSADFAVDVTVPQNLQDRHLQRDYRMSRASRPRQQSIPYLQGTRTLPFRRPVLRENQWSPRDVSQQDLQSVLQGRLRLREVIGHNQELG